jgi:ferredoxin
MTPGISGLLPVLSIAVAVGAFALMALMAAVSLHEGEPRAARRALLLSVLLPFPYLLVGVLSFPYRDQLALLLLILTAGAVVVFTVPFGRERLAGADTPSARFDERDIMFSRNLLVPGTERFREYYEENPDKKAADDRFRSQPGLLARGSRHHDPVLFSAAEAGFTAVEQLRPIVDGPVSEEQVSSEPVQITRFLKEWARKLGAVSCGVTELRDHHKYSTVGRGESYGDPVELDHRWAIAVTVEMDKGMVDHAPFGPTVMESAQQYLSSGAIAVQIAAFIRELGHPARAHIDGNYRVVCPLVARDAGLGEIGRMGLLMTPEHGPRVRISVVTTDLPLRPDPRRPDPTMIDFCARCRKCADVCPSNALPFGDRAEIDGVKRWRIDAEACFTFWCTVGTDCARCMKACPYSHPSNPLHNLVRWGVRRSPVFRAAAVKLDDFFYGGKPPPTSPSGWLKVDSNGESG